MIKGMPPIRRSVFWLKAHEYKTSEIADDLGITASTVRDHYRAGLRQLNDELGDGRTIFAALDDLEEGE